MNDDFLEEFQKRIQTIREEPEYQKEVERMFQEEEQKFKCEIIEEIDDQFGKGYLLKFADEQIKEKEKINKAIKKIINGYNLVLTGNVGSGKTLTMLYIFKTITETTKSFYCQYYFMPKLLDRLADFEERLPTLNKYVFLDDIGVEYVNEYILSKVEIFVEEIYRKGYQIVASSNLDKKTLLSRAGWERIMDRINQNCIWITLPGESRRK